MKKIQIRLMKTLQRTTKYFQCQQKLQKDANIIMIRHAESQFNLGLRTRAEQMGISHLDWFQKEKNEQFCNTAAYSSKYIDCSITQKGRQQCLKAKEQIKNNPIDIVFVSPKMRALETCDLIFQGRQTPIFVKKMVSQACRFSCDAVRPEQYSKKIQKFKKFNFPSHIDENYVYNINEKQIQHYQNYFRKNNIQTQQERDQVLMKMFKNKEIYESDKELRERAWKTKCMLRDQVLKNGYQNICIVSHWYFLTYLCSRGFGPNSENQEYQYAQNCKPFTKKLSWLLQIK